MKKLACLLLVLLPNLAPAQDLTGTLAHIDETGEFTIGYRVDRPPMSLADGAGVPGGYSVEICKVIAQETGRLLGRDDLDVTYKPVAVQDRFDAIENGEIDILCGATTKTLARAERVGFTQLTFVSGGALLSLDSARVEDLNAAAGQKIAVVAGSSTESLLQRQVDNGVMTSEIASFETIEDAVTAMKGGEVAVLASDQVVLIGQLMTSAESDVKLYLSPKIFSIEPFALAIKRGDPDFALVADRTISRLFRTGQGKTLYDGFFGVHGLTPPSTLIALYQLMGTPE